MTTINGKGWGLSHGAITVVNAIATGRGAAIGIDLATLAEIELKPAPGADTHQVHVEIDGEARDDPGLAQQAVLRTLAAFEVDSPIEAHLRTTTTVPPGRGLKSSSSAANAIVRATLAALGKRAGDDDDADITHADVVRIGVQAALAAGVTITGAFDDAAACYLGGLVATDNPDRAILHREDVGDLEVLLVVPPRRIRTRDTATAPTHPLRPIIQEAHDLVLQGEWKQAMLRNSLAYGAAYEMSNKLVLAMLDTGAIAAGISGTGPAVAIVIRRDDWDCFTDIIQTLAPTARVLVAHTNHDIATSGTTDAPKLKPPHIVKEGGTT